MKPILLWCTSRSRSSLVAKIFINHGLWWGDTPVKSCGYVTYENQNLKALIQRYKRNVWNISGMQLAPEDESFAQEIKHFVRSDKRWMFKCGAEYFLPFQAVRPFNIYIRRNIDDAARSVCEKRGEDKFQEAKEIIQWRYHFMDEMLVKYGGINIDTDKLVKKDFTEIQNVLEYCRLSFDPEKVLGAFN